MLRSVVEARVCYHDGLRRCLQVRRLPAVARKRQKFLHAKIKLNAHVKAHYREWLSGKLIGADNLHARIWVVNAVLGTVVRDAGRNEVDDLVVGLVDDAKPHSGIKLDCLRQVWFFNPLGKTSGKLRVNRAVGLQRGKSAGCLDGDFGISRHIRLHQRLERRRPGLILILTSLLPGICYLQKFAPSIVQLVRKPRSAVKRQ